MRMMRRRYVSSSLEDGVLKTCVELSEWYRSVMMGDSKVATVLETHDVAPSIVFDQVIASPLCFFTISISIYCDPKRWHDLCVPVVGRPWFADGRHSQDLLVHRRFWKLRKFPAHLTGRLIYYIHECIFDTSKLA